MSPARSLLRGSVQYLKGVGPAKAEKFSRLGVHTGRDLLYHLPHRYEDATTVDRIGDISVGQDATIIGRVISKGVVPTRRRLRVFRAILEDDSGRIECAWYGKPWLDRSISRRDLLLASGPVRFYHGRQLQPREHTVLQRGSDGSSLAPARMRPGQVFPVYPATQGLTHRQVRAVVKLNLDALLGELGDDDPLPARWLSDLKLPGLATAFRILHSPEDTEGFVGAQRRLAFEELFFLQLLHARVRSRLRSTVKGYAHTVAPRITKAFLAGLPFRLTGAQSRVCAEVEKDMASPWPMHRLLQGDVGSGKTVVAAYAMLRAIESGQQAALMAPTELLAEQHTRTLKQLLSGVDKVRPVLLTGSVTGKARQYALERIESGEARLVLGTHALIQDAVNFKSLSMVVIDEQHRFGVEQRQRLRESGEAPDVLVMSATPIPRSLALAMHGDLDLSIIDELPPGRRRVRTAVRGPGAREKALQFLGEQMQEGRQAYIVYPLIEESETLRVRAATVMHEKLCKRFPEMDVGLLHGRMSAREKEETMRRFLKGATNLLVSTTVIEVGIDVPNATLMYIEDAERFGLAQLHQLRGRVGRGAEQSYCVAFHSQPKPSNRLRIFASTNDGFRLAEEDLRLRGEGELFGTEQHGSVGLRFARLDRDQDLLEAGRTYALQLTERDPDLAHPGHRRIGHELESRYGTHLALHETG